MIFCYLLLHKKAVNIGNLKLSADFWRKEMIMIGPKNASIRKGMRSCLSEEEKLLQ